ncbi:MAG: 4Fe-4S binding protein [Phycisphaerae bacterium]|nr:4Fe-4S binding protein [Phycisphaerae bacterium]
MPKDISRRQFFRLGPTGFAERHVGDRRNDEPLCIRPPGALLDPDQFLAACERCGKCAEACPHDAIQHLGPAAGAEEGTPYLDPEHAPCHWCPSMDCIAACPSEALSRDGHEPVAAVATAELDPDQCLVSQGILCDDCSHYCPSTIRAITFAGRLPVLNQDKCVGCGLCSYYCAATPTAIRIVPRPTT